MEVNDVLIDKLANPAKLKFDPQEKDAIKNDLEKMIGFIKKMDELDTTGVEPLLHMSPNVNVLREDVIQGSISNAEVLKNASVSASPYFIVPKVIKK